MNYMDTKLSEAEAESKEDVVTASLPDSLSRQQTLLRPIGCSGIALHSGAAAQLMLKPAPPGTGIVFRRVDLDGAPTIPALWDHVVDTTMCTTIGNADGVRVATVEHLMAALAGCHVDNVIVDVDGPELPIMDGSSQPFVFLMECAGVTAQDAPRRLIEVLKPVRVEEDGRSAELLPAPIFSVGFEIDFDHRAVARQEIAVTLINGTFKKEIARARTFGFEHEVERLRAAGLALGGSLDNAVVVGEEAVLNKDGLRYEDEFVRHKVLDAVGDLNLAGGSLRGQFRGVRSGHALNNRLLRALFADSSQWRETTIDPALIPMAREVAAA